MNRLNRRRFLALGAASTASVVLVACGNESPADADLTPTQIPDVAGAPPTLAPITSTPSADQGGAAEQPAGGEGEGGGEAAGTLTITTLDTMAFDPSEAEVSPGQTIVVQNDGFLEHDLAVDEWGGPMTPLLANGQTAEFTIPEDAAVGEQFVYYCTVAGHRPAGMEGAFTIVEAGAAAAGGEEEAPAEEEVAEGEEAVAGAADAGAGEPITILALDTMSFDPSEVDVAPGQTIILQNDGFLEHDLAVDEWGGPMTDLLSNGGTAEFTIPEDAAVGEQFVYYCTVAGHRPAGMEGTFTIVEGGGGAAAAATGEEEAPAEAEEEAPEGEEAAAGAADTGGASEPLTMIALDTMSFDPSEAEVSPGQTIILQNDGFLEHDLAVDEWGGPMTPLLNNGDTAEFTIPEDAAVGEQFVYYCTVAGHRPAGMEGTFTIVEGGGGAAAAAGAAEEDATPEDDEAAAGAGDASDPMNVTIVATEWAFDPADFEVAPGGTITLVNEGTVTHGMTADALDGDFIQAGAGQSAEFTVPDDVQPGDTIEYSATNSSASGLGMSGTITIVEGSGDAAATPAASPAATPEAEGAAAGGAGEPITILALDTMSFDPSEVEVSPGQTIIVQNDGFLEHDLAVDEWDGPMTPMLNNGDTAEFTIPEDVSAGDEFEFYCTVAGHRPAGMEGTFIIV